MPEYQLELKQIVEYPRCRIYRQFIRTLMEDRSIRVSSGSGLFYFTVLCSYANFRTSYKRLGGINYTIYPGEWVCRIDELTARFRTRFQYQAISILDKLQEEQLITYAQLGRGRVIKFKIKGWRYFNTILDYNAPCQKDTGFFFLPISKASEIISAERCSEMDIILDLWMHTIYNDEQVQGSEVGPVVYMRNGSGSPRIGYSDLALRWGLSKAMVGRILKKLEQKDYLSLLTFPGRHGSVIYLNNYLSTMFQISDVMIDKEEVAMSLSLKISIPENECVEEPANTPMEDWACVSNEMCSVSKPHMKIILQKVAQMLSTQGVSCCECSKSQYKLSPLSSGCRDVIYPQASNQDKSIPQSECFVLEINMTVKKKILNYLKDHHVGADNALLGSRLCSIFGLTSSLLRKNINELRVEGYPVCSDSNGYFYAGCPEEINVSIAHLASRSREMARAKEGLRRAKDDFGNEREDSPDEVTP